MEGTHPNWKLLPVEILYSVFLLVDGKQLCNTTTVCKAWTYPAQAVLYSYVKVRSLPQLRLFHTTVTRKPQLGYFVKQFYYRITTYSVASKEDIEIQKILTNLLSVYLPNVERFEKPKSATYLPVLNALLESELKRLKCLEGPYFGGEKSEIANYSTCALLMRDRLENLFISNVATNSELKTGELYFDRLFSNLDRFKKLEHLKLDYDTTDDDIQVLEYVFESCKALKSIQFDLHTRNSEFEPPLLTPLTFTSVDEISQMIPRSDIKTIVARVDAANFPTILSYITHKFPLLQVLRIDVSGSESAPTDNHTLVRLFDYILILKTFSTPFLVVDPRVLLDSIGKCWDVSPKFSYRCIEFFYISNPTLDRLCFATISKEERRMKAKVHVIEHHWNFNWIHVNFIEIYGKYINSLRLHFGLDLDLAATISLQPRELPANFVAHAFSHCPNLKNLFIEAFILRPSAPYPEGMDLPKKFALSNLFFEDCLIYAGALEQISASVSRIKKLHLGIGLQYCSQNEDLNAESNSPTTEIYEFDMPHTKIDLVHLQSFAMRTIAVKVFAVVKRKHYYYRFDHSEDGSYETIREYDYLNLDRCTRVNIKCRTKPELHFED